MRIDKVVIGAPGKKGFKNLNQFEIDLDQTKMHTVLLGQNAAGKSNFLEALVIIFRDLDLTDKNKTEKPKFYFEIDYKCKNNTIRIIGDFGTSYGYKFFVNDMKKPMTKAAFYRDKDAHLPKYVFSYYSGVSNRLLEHFDTHQTRFYDQLINEKSDSAELPLRPLFYARLIHSHFVLLAFYGIWKDNIAEFLKAHLKIVGLESILFVLKKPNWKGDKEVGDSKFWYAKGAVKKFLNDLWNASIAPIYNTENIREDFNKHPKQDQLYLYISNQHKLEQIAKKYGSNTDFFKMLESTYISDLIQEVRVKVRKKNVDGHITFRELSEGEQQLLTVLGLMLFTKEQESLILLDEPDTHLNPLWKWQYMELLEKVVEKDESSQVIMTTHDPLVIGGLSREEIRIFAAKQVIDDETGKEREHIYTFEPDFDPKGLGVAGILTSDFFGLPSTLDQETLEELEKRNQLMVKQEEEGLSELEKAELHDLFVSLKSLGINTTDRDPLFQKFIVAMSKRDEFKVEKFTAEDLKRQNEIALTILQDLISEEQDI
jgi:predicted ATP-dependent endonuclease of OLD family